MSRPPYRYHSSQVNAMETKLDVHQVLKAYTEVVERGSKFGDGYRLNGIYVESDFDGYNLKFTDGTVTLHLSFHNTYHFEFKNIEQVDLFMRKMSAICA